MQNAMPRQRNQSGKSIFFEAIFVIGFLVVVGHLGVNFWEKYFIQTEFDEVKNNLNHLKKTIANISYAYDNLNQEMNGLLTYSITENDLPSVHTAPVGRKYKSKYTVDNRHINDVNVKSVIAAQKLTKWNPIYKNKETSDSIAKVNDTTNTSPKIAADVTTAQSKANATLGVNSTFTSKKRSAAKAKSTITTNKKPVSFGKSTITPNIKPTVDVKSTVVPNTRPTVNAKSTITTRPAAEVSTVTTNSKPISDAKSTITTNIRPDVSTATSKIKTAEDVSTITRHPLKSTAVGLCHQHEDCIHENHCKHNNFHYHKENECYRQAPYMLKF